MESTETNLPVPQTPEGAPAAGGEAQSLNATPANEAVPAVTAAPTPRPYNVAARPLLSRHELRKLEADYEELLRGLTANLSVFFRCEFDLALESLQTPSFREWVGGLAQPTHLTLFKVEPWRGICVLEITPTLGLAMTDRLMGGPGQAVTANRELSEIEIALLDQVAQFVTDAWCGQWREWQELTPALLGHESDSRYLQTSSPDSAMLVATLNARLGECVGRVQLAFPFATLKPLMRKLRAELTPAVEPPADSAPPQTLRWNAAFDDMTMVITAGLPALQMTARALPRLQVGEVLELPADSINQVQLRLGGLPRFLGRLGTRDHCWAVEVTQVLNP